MNLIAIFNAGFELAKEKEDWKIYFDFVDGLLNKEYIEGLHHLANKAAILSVSEKD